YLAAVGLARSERSWHDVVGELDVVGEHDVVGELDEESLQQWSETLGLYCGMVPEPWDVLRALRDRSPAAAIKALAEVDGPGARELFDFVWTVPCEIENWEWSPDQPDPYRWDERDLLRLVGAWIRRGRWTA